MSNWSIENGSLEKIKNQCSSKQYESVSVSCDGKKIFATRYDQRVIGDNLLYREQKVVMMNPDGSDEVSLPM
jgi:hypothetical protein